MMCFSRPKARIHGAGFKGSPFRLITTDKPIEEFPAAI
jgi:hypothetical protein